jgi:Glyoxalase-like domain
MNAKLDHLVVAADTLQQGVAWCEATLGITPDAGGEHPLFGTHNRLLRIASAHFPLAYFEIIAINLKANYPIDLPVKRWFDLDCPAVREAVKHRPRLLHFVANTSALSTACAALQALGIDRGPAVQASRMTSAGLLQWQISVRPDGQRLFHGGLPTLIEWGQRDPPTAPDLHPSQQLPGSGVCLQSLHMVSPNAAALEAAYQAIGLQGVTVTQGSANLVATLQTPNGIVTLESLGV